MTPPGNGDGSIEALKKRLDRWNQSGSEEERSDFGEGISRGSVPGSFSSPDLLAVESPKNGQRVMTLARKILLASVLFFVVAVLAGLFFAFSGKNVFSPEDVEISATGPVAVKGGEELVLQVVIANKNPVALETADFTVEYPAGTRDPLEPTKELRRTQELIGVIEPGEVVSKTVRAVLFGEEGSERTIRFSLDYRTPDSSAIFDVEKEYTVIVSSAPVAISVALPQEVLSGEEMSFEILTSVQDEAGVKNLLISANYPPGFIFKRSEPAPIKGTATWQLGDLASGSQSNIRVFGVVQGQDREIKSFRVTAGLPGENDPDTITTTYTSTFKTLTIQKPQLATSLVLAGSEDAQIVVLGGENIQGVVSFQNNLPETLRDVTVRVKFAGNGLDKQTVRADNRGFYQSAVEEIVWNKNTAPELESLGPGGNMEFNFGFSGLSAFENLGLKNRSTQVDLTVTGTRVGVSQPLETKVSRKVLFPAEAQIVARSLYSIGPFANSGPIPPKAEAATTYTIVWSIAGAGSDVSRGTVETTLPSYVTWLERSSPVGESITYNEGSRKVTWNVGDVRAGTGGVSSAREVAFQILATPSLSHVGDDLPLTSGVLFAGTDTWSASRISARADAVTTDTVTDPAFASGEGRVVK